MIRLPEIKTAELSTYGNFAMCHQALFRVPREGLGTRLSDHDGVVRIFVDHSEIVKRLLIIYIIQNTRGNRTPGSRG